MLGEKKFYSWGRVPRPQTPHAYGSFGTGSSFNFALVPRLSFHSLAGLVRRGGPWRARRDGLRGWVVVLLMPIPSHTF